MFDRNWCFDALLSTTNVVYVSELMKYHIFEQKRLNKETEILNWIWYKESHIYFCTGVNSNYTNSFIVSFFKSQHQNLVSSLFILDVDGMILCFQIAGLSCCVHFVLIAGGPSHAPTWFKLTFHESTVSVTKLGDSEAVNPWIHRWITQS